MKKLVFLSIAWLGIFSVAAAEEAITLATENENVELAQVKQLQATKGRLARHTFTSDIQDREPIDNLISLGNNEQKIYYFSDLRSMQGQTIIHRWEYAGQVMAEVPFSVKGQRWRVWSSKTLNPEWTGEWKVSVVTSDGKKLGESAFTYMDNSPMTVGSLE